MGIGCIGGYLTEAPKSSISYRPALLPARESLPPAIPGHARRWTEFRWRQIFTLDSPQIEHPELFDVTEGGELWVLEWSTFVIKHFSQAGTLLGHIQLTRGRDAEKGEVAVPTAVAVSSVGEVWVCDPIRKIFIMFKPDGTLQTIVRQAAQAYRIALLPDAIVASRTPSGEANDFDIYSPSGTLVKSLALPLISEKNRDAVVLDGEVAPHSSGNSFVYGPRWVGLIAKLRTTGEQAFVVRTVDNIPVPTVMFVHQQSRRVVRGSPVALSSINVIGNDIFVLTGVQTRNGLSTSSEGQVVDVYDNHDGKYKASFVGPSGI